MTTEEAVAELKEQVRTPCGDDPNKWQKSQEALRVVLAALDSAKEESEWVRKKLELPLGTPLLAGDGTTLAGTLHTVCSRAHGYEAYIASHKCEDKQGEIARLTVQLGEARTALDAAERHCVGLTCFSCKAKWSQATDLEECSTAHREHWKHEWVSQRVNDLKSDLFKANQFKAFTHARLDEGGVPADDPQSPHSKAGCRIGARLDLLFKQRDENAALFEEATTEAAALRAVLMESRVCIVQDTDNSDETLSQVFPLLGRIDDALAPHGRGRELAERMRLLEAVVDAARYLNTAGAYGPAPWHKLRASLAQLDALAGGEGK